MAPWQNTMNNSDLILIELKSLIANHCIDFIHTDHNTLDYFDLIANQLQMMTKNDCGFIVK